MPPPTDRFAAAPSDHGPTDLPPLEPLRRTLRVVSGKWKLEILCTLIDGPRRFTEIRRAIPGITHHMLAAQLREMEADGLLDRHAYDEMPPRVEYELTAAARALEPVAEALRIWGETHGGVAPSPRRGCQSAP